MELGLTGHQPHLLEQLQARRKPCLEKHIVEQKDGSAVKSIHGFHRGSSRPLTPAPGGSDVSGFCGHLGRPLPRVHS